MSQSNLGRGIVIFVSAVLMFTIMDLSAKLLASRVSTVQSLWARYGVQMLLVTLIIFPRARHVLRARYPGLQLTRSVFLLGATVFFFTSYQTLALTQVIATMQVSPIIVSLGAALFLKERFSRARAIALAIGLGGALIIIRPGTEAFSFWSLLPLCGVFCYSGYALVTRFVGADEDVWTSLFYSALLASVLLCFAVPFYWQPLIWSDVPLLLSVGVFGAIGQLLLIRALAIAEAGALAPYGYLGLVFATIAQLIVFQELPSVATLIGALVIMIAGIYVWQQDRIERKAADG